MTNKNLFIEISNELMMKSENANAEDSIMEDSVIKDYVKKLDACFVSKEDVLDIFEYLDENTKNMELDEEGKVIHQKDLNIVMLLMLFFTYTELDFDDDMFDKSSFPSILGIEESDFDDDVSIDDLTDIKPLY